MAHTDHHIEQRQHKAERRAHRLCNARPRLRLVDVMREQIADTEAEHTDTLPRDCEAA